MALTVSHLRFIAVRPPSYRPAKWPISAPDMPNIAPRNGPFRTLIKPISQNALILYPHQLNHIRPETACFSLSRHASLPTSSVYFENLFCQNFLLRECINIRFHGPFRAFRLCVTSDLQHARTPYIGRNTTTTASISRGRTIIRGNRTDIGKNSLSLHHSNKQT